MFLISLLESPTKIGYNKMELSIDELALFSHMYVPSMIIQEHQEYHFASDFL